MEYLLINSGNALNVINHAKLVQNQVPKIVLNVLIVIY